MPECRRRVPLWQRAQYSSLESKGGAGIIRHWSLLVYLSGNNELEPEMWRAVRLMGSALPGPGVEILLELGRTDRSLAKLLRPGEAITPADEPWTGVRRYRLDAGGVQLLGDLGSRNMADPRNLQGFVQWGQAQSRATHIALAIAGHALSVVGLITDYSGERPYVMGVPGMAIALAGAVAASGRPIELLLMDSCNMNSIEVLYELAHNSSLAAPILLITYAGGAPLRGLPYHEIARALAETSDYSPQLLQRLLSVAGSSAVALSLDASRLERIKELTHLAAETAVRQHGGVLERIAGLPGPPAVTHQAREQIAAAMEPLILGHQPPTLGPLVSVIAHRLPELLATYYQELAFARDNRWADLVTGPRRLAQRAAGGGRKEPSSAPIALPPAALCAYIARMNPRLSQNADAVLDICEQLIVRQGWGRSLGRGPREST